MAVYTDYKMDVVWGTLGQRDAQERTPSKENVSYNPQDGSVRIGPKYGRWVEFTHADLQRLVEISAERIGG